jgi:ATP/ADP translocase
LINESTEKKVAKDVSKEHSPSKLRAALFPIYGDEVRKFLLMGAIKFFVIMALTLTRDTKDTLVVTQCGAEAIAFLKVCVETLFHYILETCFLMYSSHRFMEFYQQRQDL